MGSERKRNIELNKITPLTAEQLDLIAEKKDFYSYLYSIRLDWSGKFIPIRYKDPRTGFILEGYMLVIPKKGDNAFKQTVEVYNAKLPRYSWAVPQVPINNIYPTKRNLKYLDKTSIKAFNNFKLYLKMESPIKTNKKDLLRLLKEYKGDSWTISEINSILNRKYTEKDLLSIEGVTSSYKVNCLITGEMTQTYKLDQEVRLDESKHELTTHNGIIEQYTNCKRCLLGIKREARGCNVIMPRGLNRNPDLFIIGEAPGKQEEENDQCFFPQAPAGGVLDKVLRAAGYNMERLYYTNAVLCRPEPQDPTRNVNGKPNKNHIIQCNSRLKNELHVVSPKCVVILGAIAYEAFFGKKPERGIIGNTGWIKEFTNYPVYLMEHPSYIVRNLSIISSAEERNTFKQDYLNKWLEIKEKINV